MGFLNFAFVLWKGYKKNNGFYAVKARINYGKVVKYVPVGVDLPDKYWNENKMMVSKQWGDADVINERLRLIKLRFDRYVNDCANGGRVATVEGGAACLFAVDGDGFYDFAVKELNNELKNGLVVKSTFRGLMAKLNKFNEFAPKIGLNQVNDVLLDGYKNWCMNDRGNSLNVANKAVMLVMKYLMIAEKKGLIHEAAKLSLKWKAPEPRYLTVMEMDRLKALHRGSELNEAEKLALDVFLVQCFTGLTYGDLCKLTFDNIEDNMIVINRTKNGQSVRLPIMPILKDRFTKPGSTFKNLKVLKTYGLEYQNRLLKIIAAKAEINKALSTHVARHTFATMALENGIDLHVIASLLGHANGSNITKMYARVTDSLKKRELEKLAAYGLI